MAVQCPGLQSAFNSEFREEKRQKFYLGNGKETFNVADACDFFLKRDYPHYNFEDKSQTKPLFVPPFILPPRQDILGINFIKIFYLIFTRS